MSEDFGKATYVAGRHRNPVLIYASRTDRTKVYEFIKANNFKTPGLVSWKCASCSRVKNGYRNLQAELKRKIPLILVDNDIIKEDPEKPLNAEHFCNGKEAVDAVLSRAKVEFLHRHGNDSASSSRIRETIHHFAREAAATTPVPLSIKEKKIVQRTLDANCLPLLHGVNKRRRRALLKQANDEEGDVETLDANCIPVQHEAHQNGDQNQESEKAGEVGKSEYVLMEGKSYPASSATVKVMKVESPRKRPRKAGLPKEIASLPSLAPALHVRPLPPNQIYYARVPTPPHHHQPVHHIQVEHLYHQYDHNSIEFFEEEVEGLQEEVQREPPHEQLVLPEEQDVACDIELR